LEVAAYRRQNRRDDGKGARMTLAKSIGEMLDGTPHVPATKIDMTGYWERVRKFNVKKPSGVSDTTWDNFSGELNSLLGDTYLDADVRRLASGAIVATGVVGDDSDSRSEYHGQRCTFTFPAGECVFEPAAPAQPEPERSANRVIPLDEFVGELQPREYVVEGLITADARLIVPYGATGTGKSLVVCDMFNAVHRGVPWRGLATKRGRVVYLCAEGSHDYKFRAAAYAKHHGVAIGELPPVIDNCPDLLKPAGVVDVVQQIQAAGGCDYLIVDTLSQTFTGDENSNDLASYTRNCRRMSQVLNCGVVVIHHSGKDQAKGARGHSSLRAAVDLELEVSREGESRSLRVTKAKGGADGAVYHFELLPVELGVNREGKPYGSVVVKHLIEGAAILGKAKQPPASKPQRQALQLLSAYIRATGPTDFESCVNHLVDSRDPPLGGSKDNRRRDAKTHINKLVESEYLYAHDGEMISLSPVREVPASDVPGDFLA
jgi:hypothetical protein